MLQTQTHMQEGGVQYTSSRGRIANERVFFQILVRAVYVEAWHCWKVLQHPARVCCSYSARWQIRWQMEAYK